MQIFINGNAQQVDEDLVLTQLIQTLNLGSNRFAVEINEQIIPRSQHTQHRLQPGDHVEVVTAIGGG